MEDQLVIFLSALFLRKCLLRSFNNACNINGKSEMTSAFLFWDIFCRCSSSNGPRITCLRTSQIMIGFASWTYFQICRFFNGQKSFVLTHRFLLLGVWSSTKCYFYLVGQLDIKLITYVPCFSQSNWITFCIWIDRIGER